MVTHPRVYAEVSKYEGLKPKMEVVNFVFLCTSSTTNPIQEAPAFKLLWLTEIYLRLRREAVSAKYHTLSIFLFFPSHQPTALRPWRCFFDPQIAASLFRVCLFDVHLNYIGFGL
ncbi:hypothetical protein ACN38_g13079 [Penicillium nordicum]|uniref:Uncharacterized protein n=1 Tax=Penicillium nordicum TaxID=229535 RepID=A0A0M8NXH7_9EURO|nr:hypothetical protein ACN38_g13079 [Penicillium nordicum]